MASPLPPDNKIGALRALHPGRCWGSAVVIFLFDNLRGEPCVPTEQAGIVLVNILVAHGAEIAAFDQVQATHKHSISPSLAPSMDQHLSARGGHPAWLPAWTRTSAACQCRGAVGGGHPASPAGWAPCPELAVHVRFCSSVTMSRYVLVCVFLNSCSGPGFAIDTPHRKHGSTSPADAVCPHARFCPVSETHRHPGHARKGQT